MTFPNFLIIGAAKSGTSAMYHYIRHHPEIYMSPRKETHFFAFENVDPSTKGPGDTIPGAVTKLEDYLLLFNDVRGEKAIGEASPTYLYLPRACERIQHYIPEVRMIAILRNPADRAFSAFMHLTRDGREPIADFGQALALEEERIRMNWGPIWHYKNGGLYYEQVKRYFQTFGKEKLKIYLHDEFNQNPQVVLKDVFSFLGVSDSWIPDVSIRPNVSGVPKSERLHKLMHSLFLKPNPLKAASRKMIPENVRWRVTTQMRNMNITKKPMPPQIREQLIGFFREDVNKLSQLIERDLSHWLVE
ncbi:MAG: sulfotransferase [Ardenticatenaceae bacterium]|nr:sulfotransferase [Ardenticatenaceae bacterium]